MDEKYAIYKMKYIRKKKSGRMKSIRIKKKVYESKLYGKMMRMKSIQMKKKYAN